MKKQIPIYLINGFLGSGKTTTLIKCIEYFKNENKIVALILNGLGNKNLEEHLFIDESLYELLNGCICCSIQEDLKKVLEEIVQLTKRDRIDVILIEGTGVANPGEILDLFHSKPYVNYFKIAQSICIVDGKQLPSYLSIFNSTKEIRELQKDQIKHASVIVINKLDLLRSKSEIDKVEKLILKYNKEAKMVKTSFGRNIQDILMNTANISISKSEGEVRNVHREITAVKISSLMNISRSDIKSIINDHKSKIIRAKGTIWDREENKWLHFQYSSGPIVWEELPKRLGKKEGEIILIGTGIKRDEVNI